MFSDKSSQKKIHSGFNFHETFVRFSLISQGFIVNSGITTRCPLMICMRIWWNGIPLERGRYSPRKNAGVMCYRPCIHLYPLYPVYLHFEIMGGTWALYPVWLRRLTTRNSILGLEESETFRKNSNYQL